MATTQPRQPAGTPTGGQFSVTSRSEPLSELGPDGSRRIEAFGGRVEFVDAQGDLHREDGPAVEDQRYLEWWTHGVNTRNIDRATGQDLGGTPAHRAELARQVEAIGVPLLAAQAERDRRRWWRFGR